LKRISARRLLLLITNLLLFILMLLLLSPLLTGISIHEWMGILFVSPFLFHLLFSWRWIHKHTKLVFSKTVWRHKLNYILNLLFFILVVLECTSGLMISHVVLPNLGIKTVNDWQWRALHNQVSTAIVIVASLHLAMNWQQVLLYGTKTFYANKPFNKNKNGREFIWILVKRSFLIIGSSSAIFLFCYLILGAPEHSRAIAINDHIRLRQNFISGSVQITGTIIIISLLTYMAVRYLKMRL
jgi:Domain of unknown function (DUF4405)